MVPTATTGTQMNCTMCESRPVTEAGPTGYCSSCQTAYLCLIKTIDVLEAMSREQRRQFLITLHDWFCVICGAARPEGVTIPCVCQTEDA
jgi:hypothetical protein